MNIKTVIFDWGGVLIDAPSAGIISHCSDALGITGEAFWQAYRQVEFDFYIDKISEPELWQQICEISGTALPQRCADEADSLWFEAFSTAYQPRKEMFEFVERLKAGGLKIGLLSNTEMPSLQFFTQSLYDTFDFSVFSCTEQLAKPDEKIYRLAADRADCDPQNCLFIDDKPENTAAAEKFGMKAVHFETIEQAKQQITKEININIG